MTPFKAVYGRDPPGLIRYVVQASDPPSVRDQLLQRDAIMDQLKSNLQQAQQIMKNNADKHRREAAFKVGDLVLVKLQPYRQHSTVLRKNQKLSMRHFGPFPIIAKIGTVAYKLELPATAKIHLVFHIAQLKEFKGGAEEPYIPLPLTTMDTGPTFTPAKVLDCRMVFRGQQKIPQMLIQWGEDTTAEAKWEDYQEIHDNYPTFNLEDKVAFKEGGIVMKDRMGNAHSDSDSANIPPTNLEVRKGRRIRVASTRLDGYITNM
jgi:hypothetical protein